MTNTLKEAKQSLGNDVTPYSFFAIEKDPKFNIQEIISEVHNNIQKMLELADTKKFLQTKLNICSKSLRDSGVQHVGFRLEVPSTIFGELSEVFKWTFDIEGNSDVCSLQKNMYERAKKLKLKEESFNETNIKNTRIYSLFSLEEDILNVFDNFYQQLNGNEDAAILLTSLAFYDMENLSQHRKEDSLLIDNMYNIDNVNDRWLACINIVAQYIKPSNEYMSHLMH